MRASQVSEFSQQNTGTDQPFHFRCVTAKNASHRNSAPVTTTTGLMHRDRPSLWTATPGKMIVCLHWSEGGRYLPCARLTGCVVYSVCENRKWKCTEKVCDGVCRTVGEGHYISFDGLKYSFPGLCQYVLVQVRDGDVGKESGIHSTMVSKQKQCGMHYSKFFLHVSTGYVQRRGGFIQSAGGERGLWHGGASLCKSRDSLLSGRVDCNAGRRGNTPS